MLSPCRHRTSLHAVKSCTTVSWNSSSALLGKATYRTSLSNAPRTAQGHKSPCSTPVANNAGGPKYDYRARLHTSISRLRRSTSDTTRVQEDVAKAKAPKMSVLTLEDLQSVNPKPTIYSAVAPTSSVVTVIEEPATKPKRKRMPKPQITENGASLETEIITILPQKIEPTKKTEPTKVEPPRKMPPLRAQIMKLEATYPDCVLLVRVGEFYEVCLDFRIVMIC